jgi:type IV pilus assembly protein PilC
MNNETGESSGLKSVLKIVFVWGPAAVFIVGIITIFSALVFAHMAVIVGPVFAMFIGYSLFHFLRSVARRRGMTVVSYVETAVRLNLPFDAYLVAAQRSERGVVRQRLIMIREMIQRGNPISMALLAVAEVPAEVADAAVAAERIGQLQPTLTRIMAEEDARSQDRRHDRVPFYKFYPLVVGTMVFLLVSGFMVFILPKFREIFKDFKVALPRSTEWLMSITDFMVVQTPLGIIILVLVVLGFVGGLGLLLERTFSAHARRPRNSLLDTFLWFMPVVRGLAHNRSMGRICRFLADATGAAIPLTVALDEAAGLSINGRARDKVVRWKNLVQAGQTGSAAAAAAGMPSLVVRLLDTSQAPRAGGEDNTANVFDFLARYYAARFSRLWITIHAAYEPVTVLLLGLLVAFVAYSLFRPLVVLIDAVTHFYPQVGL